MGARSNNKGYTLVELMIATGVFAVILLGAATALVQIGRLYYKGVISSRTQGVARNVTDEISRGIQFSGQEITSAGPQDKGTSTDKLSVSSRCIGTTRYTYATNAQVNDQVPAGIYEKNTTHRARHALWKDTVPSAGDCDGDTDILPDLTQATPSNDGIELLDQHMRLTNFDISSISGNENFWSVNIGIMYGDDDLLLPDANNPTGCRGSVVGGQWCAASVLNTNVVKRIQ